MDTAQVVHWSQQALGMALVLAGPPQPAREQILAQSPSLAGVVALDYVPEILLSRLLRTASVLVSTSCYEGFGLPLLEALAAGTPVVATSTPFTREVCGEAARLVQPDVEALAEAIQDVVRDSTIALRLRELGLSRAENFSWDRVVDGVFSAYHDTAT